MPITYRLTCDCLQEILVRETQAGGTVSCVCGRQVPVPTFRELQALPVLDESNLVESSPEKQPPSVGHWNLYLGMLFAIAVPLAILCLAVFAFATWRRVPLDLQKPDFREFRYQVDFDELPPTQLYAFWVGVREFSLELRPTPFYLEQRKLATRLNGWMVASGAGFAINLACICVSLTRSRRASR